MPPRRKHRGDEDFKITNPGIYKSIKKSGVQRRKTELKFGSDEKRILVNSSTGIPNTKYFGVEKNRSVDEPSSQPIMNLIKNHKKRRLSNNKILISLTKAREKKKIIYYLAI